MSLTSERSCGRRSGQREKPLAQQDGALKTGERVTNAPEEGLASCYAVYAQPDGDAEHVSSVQQCRDDPAAALYGRSPVDGFSDPDRISRL